MASYNGDVPEGVRREYNEEGKIIAGYIFTKGVLTGQGIVDEEGNKDGDWREFYTDGTTLRSVGTYSKGKTVGNWKYYFENGKLESEGKFTKSGLLDGTWRWYFDDGSIRRVQSYIAGMEDGEYEEHDETGRLIVKGQYTEGLEEGEWIYDFINYKELGSYKSGARFGKWKSFYADGTLKFEGDYIDDNLNGRVNWYWPNGKLKDQGNFVNGSDRQFVIPTLAQVEATQSDEELKQLQETMGGSYGYTLGFQQNGAYYPTRNLRRANFALASDAPSPWLPNHQSENHDRHGQNVLFEDGHVRFLASPRPNDRMDDLFLNDEGLVAAGTHQNDSVIGSGATPPIRYVRGD